MFFSPKFRRFVVSSFGVIAALGAMPAAAESLVSLKSDVKVERVAKAEGKEEIVLAAPADVVPGDKLVFSTAYANDSSELVENFVVTNPLPSAVKLAEEDASFQVSVDGGKVYSSLAKLSVVAEDGTKRPAALDDVTHLRWTLPRIAAGAKGEVSYRAIVR